MAINWIWRRTASNTGEVVDEVRFPDMVMEVPADWIWPDAGAWPDLIAATAPAIEASESLGEAMERMQAQTRELEEEAIRALDELYPGVRVDGLLFRPCDCECRCRTDDGNMIETCECSASGCQCINAFAEVYPISYPTPYPVDSYYQEQNSVRDGVDGGAPMTLEELLAVDEKMDRIDQLLDGEPT